MYVKVEPSGCVNRRGLVQVRFCMYLDAGDYNYNVHHVQVPDMASGQKYSGEVDGLGNPKNMDDYRRWADSLPKTWQDNPFHNHFIYVEPEQQDDEIMERGKALLRGAYAKWCRDEVPNLQNPPVKYPKPISILRMEIVENRIKHLQETPLERKL